ncbi:hypothetical protein CYMTET_29021 [Cymbomonas tetramitiformis]|uniref:WAT1-related protein n=1 Tax=Cymbomonas tetramitiformis TaxID=36881 RepID=A0AAE0FLN5_9CHLO|nr:hypothetical protein CYMTET_29021 [Cymbomonas tetramitiformis]
MDDRNSMIQRLVVFGQLTLAQLIWSGMHIALLPALREGVTPLALSVMRELVAVPCLALPTLLFTPAMQNISEKLTWRLLRLCAISGLCTAFARVAICVGVGMAGPVISAAVMPITPLVTFGLSLMLQVETVQPFAASGALQLVGLFVSVVAAVLICVDTGGPVVLGATDSASDSPGAGTNVSYGTIICIANTVAAGLGFLVQRVVLQELDLFVTITLQTVFSLIWQALAGLLMLPLSDWVLDWNVAVAIS